jgi:predicted ATP-grasp superfamily ATP-dependent carboligase
MQSVFLLFGDNLVAYNIASSLYRGNLRHKLYSFPPKGRWKFFSKSRFFSSFKISQFYKADTRYLEELISFLKTSMSGGEKMKVVFTNDEGLDFWEKNKKKLAPYLEAEYENYEVIQDKLTFYKKLKNIALMPETTLLENCSKETLSYPCIIKPRSKENGGFFRRFKNKVLLLNDKRDFPYFTKCESENLICQEYLPLDDIIELSFWGFRSKNNMEGITVIHKEKFPEKTGRSTYIKQAKNIDLSKKAKKILIALDYCGVFDLQFLYNKKTGELWLLEMNPRFWCGHEYFILNNYNFVENYLSDSSPKFAEKNFKAWYSILFNIRKPLSKQVKPTEIIGIENDNLYARILGSMFLKIKKYYYQFFV